MTTEAMYREKARYYDLIYSFKDYKKETQELLNVLKKYQKSEGRDLLDVGCGTGQHIAHLKRRYRCVGVDVNAPMLAIAKKRNPGVRFITQDMRKLDVGKKFDAIVSLFSAIGYITTKAGLERTIRRMAGHLKPGGALVIDPWIEPKEYRAGTPHAVLHKGKDICIARLNVSARKGDLSIIDFEWLVAPRNGKILRFKDHHVTLLTPHTEILAMMRRAGLRATRLPKGRGRLVGVKK